MSNYTRILKISSVFSLVVTLSCIFSCSYAQRESDIVAKFRSALMRGAEEPGDPPIIMKGKITSNNVVMDGTIYYSKPDNRMELTISGAKFISLMVKASLRWSYNPVNDSHRIEHLTKEQGREERNRELKFDFASKDLLNYKTLGFKLKSLGNVKKDSIETHHLRLTKTDKSVIDFFLDTRTYLIYRIESGKDFRVWADYRRYGDYVYPLFMSTISDNISMEMICSEVTVNANIPPEMFVIPQEAFDAEKKKDNELERKIATADSLSNNGKYKEAIVKYTSIIREHGDIFRAYNGRGLSKLSMQNYYEAIADFNLALDVVPTSASALSNRGFAKQELGDAKGALSDYSAALTNDSTHVTSLRNRSLLYLRQQRYEEAIKDFQKAIGLDSDYSDSHYGYAVTLAQLKRHEEALKEYAAAIKLGSRTADVYNYQGISFYKLSRFDSAAASFKMALDLAKDDFQYTENLANAYYNLQRYKEARKLFEHCVSVKADDAEGFNMIALCEYRQENYKSAIQNFTKAIEVNPKNNIYYNNRASAKELIHDFQGAIEDYSQSITIYPNDAEVFYKRGLVKIATSKKLEGCMDLGTANEMKHEEAADAIRKNCN